MIVGRNLWKIEDNTSFSSVSLLVSYGDGSDGVLSITILGFAELLG